MNYVTDQDNVDALGLQLCLPRLGLHDLDVSDALAFGSLPHVIRRDHADVHDENLADVPTAVASRKAKYPVPQSTSMTHSPTRKARPAITRSGCYHCSRLFWAAAKHTDRAGKSSDSAPRSLRSQPRR